MKKATKYILIALLFLAFSVWTEVAKSPKTPGVQVNFLDVGQGDSSLLQKGDQQVLIDGGPDESLLQSLGKLMPLTDRNIETMILTHPHADHLAGLNAVLKRYEVGKIYFTGVAYTSDGYLEFLQTIKDKKIESEVPIRGQMITPFENSTLEFLWPSENLQGKEISNLNNSSIVNRFCYFKQCVFLTGDSEIDAENEMFSYYSNNGIDQNWQSAILKVPHHGSANGANPQLYDKVLPRYAVISVGADNKYGHPHAQTLKLIEESKIKLLRTDRDGTIKFFLTADSVVPVDQ